VSTLKSQPRTSPPVGLREVRTLFTVFVALGLLFTLPIPSPAQYFGRNKVQYDDFDFEVMHTDHFRLHFYEDQSPQVVEDFGRMAERWYERFARTFEFAYEEKKPLLLYANKADFQQTNAIPGFLSQGTGGVTESVKNRVIMPLAATYGETDHVLGHELIHSFQYSIAGIRRGGGATGFDRMPGWFIEGMPEYLSVGRDDPHTAMWMRDAVLYDDVPTIKQLNQGGDYFPYRFGHALWAFIAGTYGDAAVPQLFRLTGQVGVGGAFQQVLQVHPDTLSKAWVAAIKGHYGPLVENRTHPEDAGHRVLAPGKDAGEMNLSPSLSPDGRFIAFFSERDIFSIDLFLADAETGEVRGTLASGNRNPHFDNLFFISSAGTWSPDGSRFAFVTFDEGDNGIAIAGVEDRSIQRAISLSDVDAVFALAWSPDGSSILFSGSHGGVTDLFLLDLDSERVERLTHDRYAELHPSWSPDGETIAFATDRGPGADLDLLTLPAMGLGFMDRGSGEIRVVRPLGNAKHINPQWSPDGNSLYFISDREGYSDLYRMEVDTEAVYQVTRLATGITGVSSEAPAMSVARDNGRVAFTVFQDGNYIGYTLDAQEAQGEAVRDAGQQYAGALPPAPPRRGSFVSEYLANAELGLPPEGAFRETDYDPGLQLDYLAQPSVGVAVDRFGTALGGSVAAFFSDMLGNHQLGVALQAQGRFEDIGGQAVYMNRGNRLNWGGQVGRIPFRTGFTRSGTTEVEGEDVPFTDFVISRTILYRASAVTEYPFSRTRRLEFNGGVSHLAFDRDITRFYFSPNGALLGRENVSPGSVGLGAPDGLTLYNAMAAYVGDYSYFGFTSPVDGGRHRFEVEGNFGDLSFFNVLGDYRRYLFFNPVTLAFRAMHYGRYGSDSENQRLTPIFLGHETMVRGYAVNSFGGNECAGVTAGRSCPQFDRLIGSKIALGSLELRIPLFGTDRFGLLPLELLPTELSFFVDGGVAWTRAEDPELKLTTDDAGRIPVFSTGVSARLNVLGRLVLEFYVARAFQREDQNQFGFQIAPGW